MENNRPTTGGGNTGTPTPTQGIADRRGATTPFTMAAASGAARRVREQQKALKEALNSSAKTVREREAERQKRKEEEAAAKAAADEKKKREVGEKNQTAEDASMEDPMAMEDSEDDEDNDNRGGLEEVARNLEREGGENDSHMRKRRSIDLSTATPKATALRMSSYIPHVYRHERVILDASVRMGAQGKETDRFTEFLGQIKTLLSNGKIVDRYFAINPVIMGEGRKDLREVKDVPTNMTTLGSYIKISPRCMKAFEVRPTFGANSKKSEGNDYTDMVYFAVAISCDVVPAELISRISVEWLRAGGVGIYIKEINSFQTESAFVILLLSVFVNAQIVTEELRKVLTTGLTLLTEGMGDDEAPVVNVPPFALRKNLPKLPGVDVAADYKRLNNKQKQSRRAWHVELERHHIVVFERLLEVCKDYGLIRFWGEHVIISRVVDFESPPGDIERMRQIAMRHTRYQCSMMVVQLYGIIHVDAPVTMTAGGGDGSPELTLRQILPRYLRTDDRKSPLIAEIHQIRMNGPVEVVVPKAKVAEKVVTAMNYQSAAYLKYYLMDCGLDENFVTRLVVASCCPNLVAEINQYDWDEDRRELKAIKEKEDDSKLALFEQADWYFDLEKISVSPQKKKNMEYTAPEALFNWDEAQSVNTLHAKNDARRATARRLAEGSSDSEEEDEGSEPEQHTLGKSSNDTEIGNAGEDGYKSITWSPASPSDGRHAGNSAAGGG